MEDKHTKDIKYGKVRDHCRYTGKYRGAALIICNSKYSLFKENPIVFQICYKYDYHFVIKKVVEEYEGQFTCSEENIGKYITFSFQKIQELIKRKRNHKNCILQKTKYQSLTNK